MSITRVNAPLPHSPSSTGCRHVEALDPFLGPLRGHVNVPLMAHATNQQRFGKSQLFGREGRGQMLPSCVVSQLLSQTLQEETWAPRAPSTTVLCNLDSFPHLGL